MIPRSLLNTIKNRQKKGFVNLIYGPRRVGKTVLLKQLTESFEQTKIGWFNGDTQETKQALSNTSEVFLSKLVRDFDFIVVDEAQRVPNIGLSLKILIDKFPQKFFYITGSSSLALSQGVQESLTGRNIVYCLYPLSTKELALDLKPFQMPFLLDDQLIYGGYPYLLHLTNKKDKQEYLKSICDDYLFKDVLALKDVSSPENLRKLTLLLAFQIGSEVSLNELAVSLGIDVKTIKRYLFLLKQSFIIFELSAFSRNLRKEVVKSKKYYFWDLGIRNALINQFLPLDVRQDVGQLWENFLILERVKKHEYQRNIVQYYFWRTYQQAEVDFIEMKEGKLAAYEFKWKDKSKIHTPKSFFQAYKTKLEPITKDNYLDFIL